MKKALKITAFAAALCLMLCGCKSGETDSSSGGSSYSAASSQNISEASENSSQASKVDNTVSVSDDSYDPQLSGKDTENGAEVEAEELEAKEGKANGIDVSKWQGKINWKSVKSAGVDFAIIRIGYRAENGRIYKDDCADYNIQQAIKNDILVGVYFFSTAASQSEAKEEAKWTADAIKSYAVSYPVVYDCEGYLNSGSRMYGLTNAERTDNAIAFLSQIKSAGYQGMFYSAAAEMNNSLYWDMARIEPQYKVWVAHYPSVTYPDVLRPDYSGKYDMWQYTNMGKVSGIDGHTDMVVSYFTVKKATAKSSEKAPEAEAPEIKDDVYTAVNDTVTAKDTVNLRESASTSAKIVGTLKNGETLKRTATGTNGWSKLNLDGKTVYAVTSYLTTDLSYKTPKEDDGFKAVNEKVTAKSETNLRTVPNSSDSSTIVYTLKNGEVAVRIGISDSGWSKLTFGGKTVYAVTSYLTTDLSYKPETESNTSSEESVGMSFTNVNEQVTAKSETNLRSVPSSKSSDTIVYTLKNGEYVTRTGVSESGWSRLDYKGQTVYAVTSFLTK